MRKFSLRQSFPFTPFFLARFKDSVLRGDPFLPKDGVVIIVFGVETDAVGVLVGLESLAYDDGRVRIYQLL